MLADFIITLFLLTLTIAGYNQFLVVFVPFFVTMLIL